MQKSWTSLNFQIVFLKFGTPYPEIVSLSISIACNAMNWLGAAAISFYSLLIYAVYP